MSPFPGTEELKRTEQKKSTSDAKKIKLAIRRKKKKQAKKLKRMLLKKELKEQNLANNNIDESGADKNSVNSQLDHDCLAKIFSYLPPIDRLDIKRVCKKWEETVAMSWHNVKKLDADNLPVTINKKAIILMELLKNCCQYLTHFKSNLQYYWMSDIMKNNCKNIVHFDVNLCSKYANSFYKIIGSMSKLKCLKVAVSSKGPSYNLCIRLVNILPADIEEIHLLENKDQSGYYKIPDAPELNKFSNLRCLSLHHYRLTTATMETILLSKNTLIYLDLNGCEFVEQCPIIFRELVNLEHLNLGKVDNLNSNVIIEIAHNCPELKHFEFRQDPLPRIAHSTFCELKYLKNLEHLEFPAVDEADDDDDYLIADVVDNCKKLKHFNVGRGSNFSTLDIYKITRLNNLEYLNLDWAKVDSQSMSNIASNCLELKELKIDFEKLSETDIEKLINLKKLEKLDFEHCNDVAGNLLSKFAFNCKNLVELDLTGCCNVTEACLIQFGKLKYLKKLKIDYIPQLPNAMFNYFHELEYLSCYNCPSVTDENIINVIDNCQKLSELHVLKTGITTDILVHAGNRQLGFKVLSINVDTNVFNNYLFLQIEGLRYLEINGQRF